MVRVIDKKKVMPIIVTIGMIVAMLFACHIQANAMNVISQTFDSTTYTGSITYTTVAGPSGYYTMALSSGRTANRLYESVSLKSSGGVTRPSISGSGSNTSYVSARTGTFSDGYYTTKGYYYYSVTTHKGNDYTFSTTK
ncbi:MAG: hypothetical protein J6A82_00745 [Coprococcus sp.]|nr:hypothetical protein [Coprococcus sp.]